MLFPCAKKDRARANHERISWMLLGVLKVIPSDEFRTFRRLENGQNKYVGGGGALLGESSGVVEMRVGWNF